MTVSGSLVAAATALGGVVIGALLSAWQQRHMQQLSNRRMDRSALEQAYVEHLTACRQFRHYLLQHPEKITVSKGPSGPTVEGASEKWDAIDKSVMRLTILAGDRVSMPLAWALGTSLRELAEASYQKTPEQIPDEAVERCRLAERAFADAARQDLRLHN